MSLLHFDNISIDEILLPEYALKSINVSILRLDKIHPVISGNKWFKLKYYLDEALSLKKTVIATFGGAWSNHIVATAAACHEYNLRSVGIIRGEAPRALSPTLVIAESYGMKLIFIPRMEYKEKIIPHWLKEQEGDVYLINEGGYGVYGAKGAETIGSLYAEKWFTHICCAIGTGTMMAGLIKASLPGQKVMGISVLKNNPEQESAVANLLTADDKLKNYEILPDYHFGGYAKYTPHLIDFMNKFFLGTGIPSDFVYTGKLFYAVNDLIATNFFPAGSRLLIVHSGGLQGNQSLKSGTLIF